MNVFEELNSLVKDFDDMLDSYISRSKKKEYEAPKCSIDETGPCKKKGYKEEDENSNFELTPDVHVENENLYKLNLHVKDFCLTKTITIPFEGKKDDLVVPGITDEQLLFILLFRNRNNKDRYNKIKSLLMDDKAQE